MSTALNLVLVAPSLTAGGAERVLQLLARGFSERGHRVRVITTSARQDFYELSARVDRIRLDLTGVAAGQGAAIRNLPRAVPRLVKQIPVLRRTLAEWSPDVVVSFMDQVNVITVAATVGRWPVVVTEHSDPKHRRTAFPTRVVRRLAYTRALCLVSVSHGVDEGFAWLSPHRRVVIHNPVDVTVHSKAPAVLPPGFVEGRFVVGLGRLKHEKGFDLLVEAFDRIGPRRGDWRLAIIGDGLERQRLERDIRLRGLGDSVALLGMLEDPFPYLRKAGLFALPSRWEGFGNALAEALACGLPAVSFDCESGPAEIIEDEENGLLVPPEDVGALARAMVRLMEDDGLRRRLGVNAFASSQRFSLDRIVSEWEDRVFSKLGKKLR